MKGTHTHTHTHTHPHTHTHTHTKASFHSYDSAMKLRTSPKRSRSCDDMFSVSLHGANSAFGDRWISVNHEICRDVDGCSIFHESTTSVEFQPCLMALKPRLWAACVLLPAPSERQALEDSSWFNMIHHSSCFNMFQYVSICFNVHGSSWWVMVGTWFSIKIGRNRSKGMTVFKNKNPFPGDSLRRLQQQLPLFGSGMPFGPGQNGQNGQNVKFCKFGKSSHPFLWLGQLPYQPNAQKSELHIHVKSCASFLNYDRFTSSTATRVSWSPWRCQ